MATRNGSCVENPQKRQAILDQAIRTFAELGYRGTDVQVIADRAAVGKGTVYRYFGSKEDLFWVVTLEVLARLDQHLEAALAAAGGAIAKMHAAALAHAHFFSDNPQYLDIFVQEQAEFRGAGPKAVRDRHERMIERFRAIVQQGVDAGELRPVDAREVTVSLGCLLYGTTVLGNHLQTLSVPELSEFAADVFLAGLRM